MRSRSRRRRRRWTMNGDENIPKQNRIYSFATRPRILFRIFSHRRVSLFPSFFSFFFSFFLRIVVFLEANKNGINSFCWTKCNRRATEVTQSKHLHKDFIPFSCVARESASRHGWICASPLSNWMEQRKRNVLCDTSNGRKSLTFNYQFSPALLFRFVRGKNVTRSLVKHFHFSSANYPHCGCGRWSSCVSNTIECSSSHTYAFRLSVYYFIYQSIDCVKVLVCWCRILLSIATLHTFTTAADFPILCARIQFPVCLTFSTISHSFSRLSCLIWIVFIGFGGAGVKAKILYSISTA